MPVHEKASKGQVTFALAIVRRNVISNRAKASKIEAALQAVFPGVSVILVAEDDDALANYRSRRELSDFAGRLSCRVVPSSKISLN
jgi:hypothetical protein